METIVTRSEVEFKKHGRSCELVGWPEVAHVQTSLAVIAYALYLFFALFTPLSCAEAADAPEGHGPGPRLEKSDAAKLAAYAAQGRPTIILSIVSAVGQNSDVVRLVNKSKGRVEYHADDVDYITAVIPIESFQDFLKSSAITAIALDNVDEHFGGDIWLSWPEDSLAPEPRPTKTSERQGDAPYSGISPVPDLQPRPLQSTFSILPEIGADTFRSIAGVFDGRGVVIAHIEDFPDFAARELQVAYDSAGREIPKFVDIINIPAPANSLNPEAPRPDDRWTSRLSDEIESADQTIVTPGGKRFKVGKDGSFRLARFSVRSRDRWMRYLYKLAVELCFGEAEAAARQDVVFDVLWSDAEGKAWIDSNCDGDFSNDPPVREYRRSFDIGMLGADDPDTDVREGVSYSVQRDGEYIGLNFAVSHHATMVAGAAAANSTGSGLVEGVAPGAQLLSILGHNNSSISAYARAMVTAFRDSRVDVVLLQGHALIQPPHRAKDGSSLLAILLDRLVRHYRKPTVATAGNEPVMTAAFDYSAPSSVLSIGASESARSRYAYYGFMSVAEQDLHHIGAEGPAGDGALKPDVLAPANPVTIINANEARWDRSSIYPGVFQLPVGYYICGGTSCAAPVAAGAAALLVGAAKLKGLPHDADAIHEALRNTASFMGHVPAYKQGRGILQVDAAWRYLVARAKAKERYDIEVAAPVRTVWTETLPKPHTGRGLFEREGWRAGMRQERVIQLTRRSGPKEPVRFTITWQGNSGAFTSPASISLPLNQPVPLKVDIAVEALGVYSAIIHLTRPTLPGPAVSVPVTIVVPAEFSRANGFAWNGRVGVNRPGRASLFFRVPSGVSLFTVTLRSEREGAIVRVISPENPGEQIRVDVLKHGNVSAEVAIPNPVPGTWEVMLHERSDKDQLDWLADRRVPLPPSHFEVDAKISGTSMSVHGSQLRARNIFSDWVGKVDGGPLGGQRTSRLRIEAGKPAIVDIEVEDGQELLGVELNAKGDSLLDGDVYLFDCTRPACELARKSDALGSSETIVVRSPAPGLWKAVVIGTGVGERAAVSLTDYFVHPRTGGVIANDFEARRVSNEVWEVGLSSWRAAPPRKGYAGIGTLSAMESGSDFDGRLSTRDAGTLHRFPLN